jgi:hypothetical protein
MRLGMLRAGRIGKRRRPGWLPAAGRFSLRAGRPGASLEVLGPFSVYRPVLRCPWAAGPSDDPASAFSRAKRGAHAVFRSRPRQATEDRGLAGFIRRPNEGLAGLTRRPNCVAFRPTLPTSHSASLPRATPYRTHPLELLHGLVGGLPDSARGVLPFAVFLRAGGVRTFRPIQPACRHFRRPPRGFLFFLEGRLGCSSSLVPNRSGARNPASGLSRDPAVPNRRIGPAAAALGFFLFQVCGQRPVILGKQRACVIHPLVSLGACAPLFSVFSRRCLADPKQSSDVLDRQPA